MAVLEDYLGQVLDDKYRLERLLGKGGMGAVYLATHLGTERYVALKLITPQFMTNDEFVERFKREARAAGRLRHPNVVDVTDFGFAQSRDETVAYLVMEYLDGCTLGDVLKEEARLPLEWVVDILEQVCSAVHEAHQQGIVHRDLKPENIWLEPNRLGGYRVKVLDFGIAKVGRASSASTVDQKQLRESRGSATRVGSSSNTHFDESPADATALMGASASRTTNITNANPNLENETVLYTNPQNELSDEVEDASDVVATQLFTGARVQKAREVAGNGNEDSLEDNDGTLLFAQATHPARTVSTGSSTETSYTAELTRVGAIMGTPTYMSPEQCKGKSSDVRSDIYSLGVIAYQVLAGDPPFTGDTSKVMRDHVEAEPMPLRERTKVPKRVASVIMSALAKDPDERPQSAVAFANSLRAQAEGIGSLYRRAFALYSEYFPKFLKLSLIAHIPVIITTFLLVALELAERAQPKGMNPTRIVLICAVVVAALLQIAAYFVAASAISGMTAVIVTQVSAAPLRPVELRTAFEVLKRRWKPFLKTSIRVTLRILIGYLLLVVPGFIATVRYAFYAPVVLLEGLEKKAAMKRARELASRSWRTVITVTILQFLIPIVVSALIGRFSFKKAQGGNVTVSMQKITQQLSGLINIIIIPLISIVPALLYLKMRQLGGETLGSALSQIEEMDSKRPQWQHRMRSRLSLPTIRSRS